MTHAKAYAAASAISPLALASIPRREPTDRDGEIDIVAREGSTTVIVEVKTRGGAGFGHPLEAITPRKLARLRRLAGAWCAAHGPVRALRIDAVAVVAGREGITIEHVRQVA